MAKIELEQLQKALKQWEVEKKAFKEKEKQVDKLKEKLKEYMDSNNMQSMDLGDGVVYKVVERKTVKYTLEDLQQHFTDEEILKSMVSLKNAEAEKAVRKKASQYRAQRNDEEKEKYAELDELGTKSVSTYIRTSIKKDK